MDNFDLHCQVLKRAGHHVTKKAAGDLKNVVDELVKYNAFTSQPNRKYNKFNNVKPTILDKCDIK